MVKRCSIKNCKSEWAKDGDMSFHGCPKQPELFDVFVKAIPKRLRSRVNKYSFICSKHFTADSYHPPVMPSFKNILKKKAVPTLFDHDVDSSTTTTSTISITESKDPTPIVEAPHQDVSSIKGVTQSHMLPQFNRRVEASLPTYQDVGTETSREHLPPTDEEIRLRNTIKILQKRLRRRETRIHSMAEIIKHLKNNVDNSDFVLLPNLSKGSELSSNESTDSVLPPNGSTNSVLPPNRITSLIKEEYDIPDD